MYTYPVILQTMFLMKKSNKFIDTTYENYCNLQDGN